MCCGQSEDSEAFQTLAFHEANTFRHFRSQQSTFIRPRLRWRSDKARISDTSLRIQGLLHSGDLASQPKLHPEFISKCKKDFKGFNRCQASAGRTISSSRAAAHVALEDDDAERCLLFMPAVCEWNSVSTSDDAQNRASEELTGLDW